MAEISKPVKITDPTRIITLANGLSVLRAFLAFPIVYCLSKNLIGWSISLIILAVITDSIDGFFARRAQEVTSIGKVLDPLADKIVLLAVVFFLVLDQNRGFPFWFLILYIIRDLTISILVVYLMNRFDVMFESNLAGKWSIGISAFAIFLYVINLTPYDYYTLLFAAVLIVISFIQYLKYYLSYLNK